VRRRHERLQVYGRRRFRYQRAAVAVSRDGKARRDAVAEERNSRRVDAIGDRHHAARIAAVLREAQRGVAVEADAREDLGENGMRYQRRKSNMALPRGLEPLFSP
jgi:hypothetical protein